MDLVRNKRNVIYATKVQPPMLSQVKVSGYFMLMRHQTKFYLLNLKIVLLCSELLSIRFGWNVSSKFG